MAEDWFLEKVKESITKLKALGNQHKKINQEAQKQLDLIDKKLEKPLTCNDCGGKMVKKTEDVFIPIKD